MKRLRRIFGLVLLAAGVACGGDVTRVLPPPPPPPSPPPPPPPPPPSSAPFNHVFLVVEENTNYGSVIGNSAMPYLNGLARQYGLATQYYADTHPSIGNYFMLTVGDIVTNNDSYSGPPDVGKYARRHNTLALLADVVNDSTQVKNLVPFSQFPTDLASNTLPNWSFIVPNLCNDAHDCSLATADAWLETNIEPLIQSAQFQKDGLLIIVFDESASDNAHGGGRIAWVTVSAKAKRGYESTTLYQHASTLRLSLSALGLTTFPNEAASAPPMDEFYTVTISR
jgi:phosphatidylinositol-3-phosphatase